MSKEIVLIACAKTKLPHSAKAKEIYGGALFSKCYAYANKLSPDFIYILSAKYGLLRLNQEVDTYEQTLNKMRTDEIKEWAGKVLTQLKEIHSLEEDEFTFLAGVNYRKFLLPYIRNYKIPLNGLRQGKQLQRLNELLNEITA